MFKTWKENRENKRDILLYQSFLLRTLAEFILEFKKSQDAAKQSGITNEEAIKILNDINGIDKTELISKIVDSIKTKEKAK
jgi:hypothetical protein